MDTHLEEWNVVVTAHEGEYRQARKILASYGQVSDTDYYNVMVMRVDDLAAFIDALARAVADEPGLLNTLGRVMPVTATFTFQSPEQFESLAQQAIQTWLHALEGKSFHVRMHRRGFKGRLASQHEEQFLDHFIIEHTQMADHPARVTFGDPDIIIAVETVGQQAGMSLWRREDLTNYSFLGLD